jgi:hypothetical protein
MFREDLEKLQIRAIFYSKYSTKSIMFIVLNLAGRKYLLGHKTCTFLNKSVASESNNRHSDINCKELNHSTAQGNLVLNNGQNAPLTLSNSTNSQTLQNTTLASLSATTKDGSPSLPPDPGRS